MSAVPVEHKAKEERLSTALATTKRNTAYLFSPQSSDAPASRRTRVLLRSLRYIFIFAFWRIVRYAKYAAVGALTAAVAGTALGSVTSGVGFILAPPGIVAGAGIGLVWAVAKFGFRTAAGRIKRGETGADPRADEREGKREDKYPAERVEMKTEPW